jgi:hypothetical protein
MYLELTYFYSMIICLNRPGFLIDSDKLSKAGKLDVGIIEKRPKKDFHNYALVQYITNIAQ